LCHNISVGEGMHIGNTHNKSEAKDCNVRTGMSKSVDNIHLTIPIDDDNELSDVMEEDEVSQPNEKE
jgi:hypothetical protein